MGILQIYTDTAGQIGVNPRRVKIISSDNLAAVTTAGYLNLVSLEGYVIYNTDIIDMWYGAVGGTAGIVSPGTYEVFIPSISNGVITLSQWTNGGDVLLPVVSGHVAVFNGTSGQIKDSGVTFSNGTDTVSSLFHGTATAGDFVTVNNANKTIQDSGAAPSAVSQPFVVMSPGSVTTNHIAQFSDANGTLKDGGVLGTAAAKAASNNAQSTLASTAGSGFTIGHLITAGDTVGSITDSGIVASSISGAVTQLGQLYQASVTFNTAQMVTAYDTPLQIVANPAASQMILLHFASVYVASTGHTAYATGTAPIIQYSSGGTNGQHGAGTIATAAGLVAGDITAAASQVRNLYGLATSALTGLSGLGIYFSNATGDYTSGTGTSVTITVVYELLTATV